MPIPDRYFPDAHERREAAQAACLAHLHALYRNDLPTLQAAIAGATGEHRERLQRVLANLRNEKR
jgi:hypothetical protein